MTWFGDGAPYAIYAIHDIIAEDTAGLTMRQLPAVQNMYT